MKSIKRLLSTTVLRPFRHSCLHWRIGLRRSKTSLWVDGMAAMPSFRWLESPRGHFYADPMLLEDKGRTWLFAEDYLHASDDARCIIAAEIGDDGSAGPFRPVLETEHHISYPFVFRHQGAIYMVPETAADRTVRLYRATDFPFSWRCEGVLFPHPAYDTTPFEHDGTWYFFATIPERGGSALITHLFWADSLTGRWHLHPASPVGGHGESRGAGPVFREDGRLIRPTQCGRPIYGYSFSFDEIVQLDRRTFVQRRLATFEPTWRRHLRGMHTYGRCGSLEVIDGCWGVNPYDVM
jgi:hypothetical protein